jgi:hypothetical protein
MSDDSSLTLVAYPLKDDGVNLSARILSSILVESRTNGWCLSLGSVDV